MRTNRRFVNRIALLASLVVAFTVASSRLEADPGTCRGVTTALPFTDVMSRPFFSQIAAAFSCVLAIATSATTYSPSQNVPREQIAAFITRTQDSGNKRAALRQFWTTTPRYVGASGGLGTTTVGSRPALCESDGADVWVGNLEGTVSRVRGSDGKLLDTWTGATSAGGVLVAMGRVFVTGGTNPGRLYMIDPTKPAGEATEVTSGLGLRPLAIAFDGSRIWTANTGGPPASPGKGSVSIITPKMTTPWSVTSVSAGLSNPEGILFDGSNVWVTDAFASTLLKLDGNGAILQTVPVGAAPSLPAFDGTNIWVPNINNSTVSVVRAATGAVVATLTGNGLFGPIQAAFDGQRILVTNGPTGSVSVWNAADLSPIGHFDTGPGTSPAGACSDGTYFWVTLQRTGQLARF